MSKGHNIVIVGAGEIGRHIALQLSKKSHFITVIESDEAVAAELERQIDGRVICGDGTSIDKLLDADVAEADFFMALTADNNINLVACYMVKKLWEKSSKEGKTFCRVHPGLERDMYLFDAREHFNIDYIFSSEQLTATELAKSIRNPDSLIVEELARGFVELQQVRISPKSAARGKTLRELNFPDRVRIGGIMRGDKIVEISPDEVLQAADIVTLFGEPKRLHDLIPLFDHNKRKPPKVAIFGGGEYGFSLAKTLDGWDARVRIFEANAKLCEELDENLENATVLNIDATYVADMKEENLDEVDFFVATTEMDQDNVMTCLQAQKLGAKHSLTLVHRADYADAITSYRERMGIMEAISPRDATLKDLEREMTSGSNYNTVKSLHVGELISVTVAEGSIAAGQKVKDVQWPPGCVLVALGTNIRSATPAADDDIIAENHLFALLPPKMIKKFIKLVK